MPSHLVRNVNVVTGKQFVTAIARHRDGNVLSGELADIPRGNSRRVVKWRVVMGDQRGHDGRNVRFYNHLVVVGLTVLCHPAGVWQLREVAVVKADREGLDGLFYQLAHHRDDNSGIDATAEKSSERNVRDHTTFNSIANEFHQFARRLLFVEFHRGFEIQIPPGLNFNRALAIDQRRRGREFLDVSECCMGRQNVSQSEQLVDRQRIRRARHAWVLQDGLDLGPKNQLAVVVPIVQRLDTKSIAREDQRLIAKIPDCNAEHAVQVLHEVKTVLFEQVDDRFGIAAGIELVSQADQTITQLAKIVDLAIEYDGDRAILVKDWLCSAGNVDDRKASHCEAHAGLGQSPGAVGAPVVERRTHACQRIRIRSGCWVSARDSGDSAHSRLTSIG